MDDHLAVPEQTPQPLHGADDWERREEEEEEEEEEVVVVVGCECWDWMSVWNNENNDDDDDDDDDDDFDKN